MLFGGSESLAESYVWSTVKPSISIIHKTNKTSREDDLWAEFFKCCSLSFITHLSINAFFGMEEILQDDWSKVIQFTILK